MSIANPPTIDLTDLQRRYTAALTRRNRAQSHVELAAMSLRTATLQGNVAGRVEMARAYHLATLDRENAERELATVLAEIDAVIADDLAGLDAIDDQAVA